MELSKLPVVRNMQQVTPVTEEYKFELTDGFGFDKTHYKVYILQDSTTKQPILSMVLDKGADLFSSKFIVSMCHDHGLSALVKNDKVVLTIKLSSQKSNIFTFMKFYDFIVAIKTLIEFRETINRNGKEEL